MRVSAGLGHYEPGPSWIHGVAPAPKVLCTLALMTGTFLVSTPVQMLVAAAMVCALCAAARRTPWAMLRSVLPVCLGLWAVSALNVLVGRGGTVLFSAGPVTVTTGGLVTAGLFGFRLTVVLLCGAVLLATTTPAELSRAFQDLLRPFRPLGVPVDSLALVLALALRFVPLLAEEAEAVANAQEARGAAFSRGGVGARIAALPSLVVPIFAGALRHAQNLSRALDARGYDPDAPRTRWRVYRLDVRGFSLVVGTMFYLLVLAATTV